MSWDNPSADILGDLAAWSIPSAAAPPVLLVSQRAAHELDWRARMTRLELDWRRALFPRWAAVQRWLTRRRREVRSLRWELGERLEENRTARRLAAAWGRAKRLTWPARSAGWRLWFRIVDNPSADILASLSA